MTKGNIVLIPDVGGFCSGNLKMIKDVSLEAKQILPIFSEYDSAKDFLEDALGYSVDAHTEAAYLVPLNHARLDAVDRMLYDDNTPLLGPNATEKQIKKVVAALKTEKSDLKHHIKAELDNLSDGSFQYSQKDLTSAIRAATAQQIPAVVPPHLCEKYRDELGDIAAYLDDGNSSSSKSSHVSLIRNEAGKYNAHDFIYKGLPITAAAIILATALYKFFEGAGGISKEVVYDSEVQYDSPVVGANNTPDNQDQIVPDENRPDWLIQKKNSPGNEYFEIDRDLLPIEGAGLKLVDGNDDKYDDSVMKPNDGVPEMMAGIDEVLVIDLEGNENMCKVGVLIVDNDFFNKYDGVLAQGPDWGKHNQLLLDKENVFSEISDGVFATMFSISNQNHFSGTFNSKGPVIAYENHSPVVGVDDTPNPQAADEEFNNRPDWLIQKKNVLGNEYFKIDRDLLPLEGAGLRLVKGNDNNYDDGDMKPNDGVPEMMAGIDLINGDVIIVIDKDLEIKYGGAIPKISDESNNRIHHTLYYDEIAPDIFCAKVPIEGHNEICFVGKSKADDLEDLKRIPIIAYETNSFGPN
ncbi:MAG: hypothetical protein KAS90_03740 [Candidatus Aenigmarchaeota archaeon]|nr:hypothetical protein [Candidatus Aenigmarchaeota archaeon]